MYESRAVPTKRGCRPARARSPSRPRAEMSSSLPRLTRYSTASRPCPTFSTSRASLAPTLVRCTPLAPLSRRPRSTSPAHRPAPPSRTAALATIRAGRRGGGKVSWMGLVEGSGGRATGPARRRFRGLVRSSRCACSSSRGCTCTDELTLSTLCPRRLPEEGHRVPRRLPHPARPGRLRGAPSSSPSLTAAPGGHSCTSESADSSPSTPTHRP